MMKMLQRHAKEEAGNREQSSEHQEHPDGHKTLLKTPEHAIPSLYIALITEVFAFCTSTLDMRPAQPI
jgi:hypothetical protein